MSQITQANARDFQQRGVIARKRNDLRREFTPNEPDIFSAVKRQISEVLQEMETTHSRKEKQRLIGMLEKLWNMVYPKAGARKPGRADGRGGRSLPVATGDWTPDMSTEVSTQSTDVQSSQ